MNNPTVRGAGWGRLDMVDRAGRAAGGYAASAARLTQVGTHFDTSSMMCCVLSSSPHNTQVHPLKTEDAPISMGRTKNNKARQKACARDGKTARRRVERAAAEGCKCK